MLDLFVLGVCIFLICLIPGTPTLTDLLSKLLSVVQDESSIASKLGLVALKQCLNALLNSVDAPESFIVLETLLKVKSNSYWLSKVRDMIIFAYVQTKSIIISTFNNISKTCC